jgi:hypothetical protein
MEQFSSHVRRNPTPAPRPAAPPPATAEDSATPETPPRHRATALATLAVCATFATAALLAAPPAAAQLDSNCTVSILNRTAQVQSNGSWIIPNVPANFGQVRARATCVESGVTVSGESGYFTVQANAANGVAGTITLGAVNPIPENLSITASSTQLSTAQPTAQLAVTATFPDGTTADVTAAPGTTYAVSNPQLASVSPTGLVTAKSAGLALVSVTKDGALGILQIGVGLPDNGGTGTGGGGGLGAALQSIAVTPNPFVLTIESLLGLGSLQLKVTGTLIDGTALDLTSQATGTLYSSSDLSTCNFGGVDGLVFGGNNGPCTITVTNSGFTATAAGTVQTFTPTALSFVAIPGYANAVDVAGNRAYVAAGAAGLQVVAVDNRLAPVVIAGASTPGNADDVRVVGNFAYVADDSAGLQIFDVSNPAAPVLAGALALPGTAQNLAVQGNLVYVAANTGGLQIVDVSNPATPVLVGTAATSFSALGVDVTPDRTLAAVAEGTLGLELVDVSNPTAPAVLGNVFTGDARDVAIQGTTAFVADYESSFTAVDISVPSAPVVLASLPLDLSGRLLDLVLANRFAFGADVVFVNGVPITDISVPANPIPRAILDFSAFRDDNGMGIAVDSSYVYLTAVQSFLSKPGITGDSRLYIGQYLSQQDSFGIPPVATIVLPADGETVIAGQTLPITVDATDDVAVASVDFLVDGTVVGTLTAAPYQFTIGVPSGVSSLTLGALAHDFGDNTGAAAPVVLQVIPDPLTTVAGKVVDSAGNPVGGATVTVGFGVSGAVGVGTGPTGITLSDGTFSIPGVTTINGTIYVAATATVAGIAASGTSVSVPPARGGITNTGTTTVLATIVCVTGTLVYASNSCISGPATGAFDLLHEPDLALVATVTSDAAGNFCATVMREQFYLLREEQLPACQGAGSASTRSPHPAATIVTGDCATGQIEVTDPAAAGACGDPGAICHNLGSGTGELQLLLRFVARHSAGPRPGTGAKP